jgi:hypothetical protein
VRGPGRSETHELRPAPVGCHDSHGGERDERMTEREKPQGRSGAIRLSSDGAKWEVIGFPKEKRRRELMIAEMFVRGANQNIMLESPERPPYTPFGGLTPNDENDLDFTITTSQGVKAMELVEFAPLHRHGPRFKDAPRQLHQTTKSELLLELVRNKSDHQGGSGRLLLIYATEYGFKIDLITIEITRRALVSEPPRFERVYYLSCHDVIHGSVWEIFPGRPDPTFEGWPDEKLRGLRAQMPHPLDLIKRSSVTRPMRFQSYGGRCLTRFPTPTWRA